MAREDYAAQVALLVRILPYVAKEKYLRSRVGRPSTSSIATFRASRSISI